MSDCLHPEEPQAAVRDSELRESAVSEQSREQTNVPVKQGMLAASAGNSPGHAMAECASESGAVGEQDEATGEDRWLSEAPPLVAALPRKPMAGPRKGRRLVRREDASRTPFTAEQRLLILD